MKLASNKFDVVFKDSQGNEHQLWCYSYDEFENIITVKTSVYDTELFRGWIGDLSYSIRENVDIEALDENDFKIIDTYKDVLLINIVPSASVDKTTVWKYTFLKK